MPYLVRKAIVFAAPEGLVISGVHSKEKHSLLLDYKSHRAKPIATIVPEDDVSFECYGIVVAIIPLSSQIEATNAIKQTQETLREESTSDSESDDSDGENVHEKGIPATNSSVEERHGTWAIPGFPRGQGLGFASWGGKYVAEDVLSRKGAYGRFTERWFSKNGWALERRRVQGMSQEGKDAPDNNTEADEHGYTSGNSDDAAQVSSASKYLSSKSSVSAPSNTDHTSSLLPKLLRTTNLLLSSGNLFFSYDIDITRRVGTQTYSKESETPLYKSVDPTFFWNRHLIEPFVSGQHHSFVLPLMQGFVGQRGFRLTKTQDDSVETVPKIQASSSDSSILEDTDFLLTLISRRSIHRPGLRYLRRGVDNEGHTANSVETEQILSKASWARNEKMYSLTQIRGSIPLFFSQSPYSFKPVPILQQSEDMNRTAFKRHFASLNRRYGTIQIVSLVDRTGGERAIGERYETFTSELNSKTGSEQSNIGFEWFDFHRECRGMQFQNVSILMDTLSKTLKAFGQTVEMKGILPSRQQGIIRTNCMDCLDRSNVVQSAFGQRALEDALKEEGVDVNLRTDTSTQWFNSLWADNGDAISKQYSSTAALKGDFTRTRRRNYRGAINDLVLTLSRYYNNIFNDYFSQAAIDYLLGNVNERVFQDFEEKLMTSDPGMSMQTVRDNAVNASSKVVIADPNEDLIGGWTLLSPGEPDRIKSVPLEETVLLLTNAAMYKVCFDWTNEKVFSFERVKLRSINGIYKGTYITSTLTPSQCEEARNVGFVVRYQPGKDDIARINTRSLSTSVGIEASPLGPEVDREAAKSEKARAEKVPNEKILAFKALPSQSSLGSSIEESHGPTEKQTVDNVCEEVRRAAVEDGNSIVDLAAQDKDIVSLEEARKGTGYVEQWTHSIKRLESMRPDGAEAVNAGGDKPPKPPAFQIIVLGGGGGPIEDNVTGLLVRSTATNWAKGSVLAVDAGAHLAAVTKIIHHDLPNAIRRPSHPNNVLSPSVFSPPPPDERAMSIADANGSAVNSTTSGDGSESQLVLSSGPFTDFELPHATAKANAAYFVRNLITTYLITHPHLDHISGFVINTAGFQHTSRPKRLAGLPSTIDAFKTHIFNDTIWPNLSDEDGGVGLVSYMRLAEGGNLAIGEGEGRGYIEVCDGLAVKSWSVSHGKCMHNHGKRASGSGHTLEQFNDSFSRRASASATTPNSLQYGRDHTFAMEPCVIDSSAFFLRDDHTGHEVLIFGDVEPDSLSLSPRTAQVWTDAAPKAANGLLKGILIECSYDESQSDDTLFGHLSPRHVIAELQVLAGKVHAHKNGFRESTPLKRKRASNGIYTGDETSVSVRKPKPQQMRRKSRRSNSANIATPNLLSESSGESHALPDYSNSKVDVPDSIQETPLPQPEDPQLVPVSGKPLEGLQVIIIHVKDNLRDEPEVGDTILAELQEKEREARLGCTFAISKSGTSIWL
ncbi:uncharacterized protein KY384_006525 [Bacidia gigantensis]|uniref:uncharacterized protein n=1 Tax=Bacidia gigantensis TaxID=2732470 RepID=UPI001D059B0D|nr:uncharacterized protein KY384_006525 [Bacidia gigantensis]KAG8528836.1 hypothetical protein KY384_006525 [Bacidia gigantensis]